MMDARTVNAVEPLNTIFDHVRTYLQTKMGLVCVEIEFTQFQGQGPVNLGRFSVSPVAGQLAEKRSPLNWEAITMRGLGASDIHLEAANIVRELRQENLRHGGCDRALGAVLCGYLGVMAGSIPFTKAVSK